MHAQHLYLSILGEMRRQASTGWCCDVYVPFCSDRCLSKIWCVIRQSSWVWGRFITVLRETQGLQKHLKLHGVCAVKDKTLTHPVNSESPLWDLSLAWRSYRKQQSQDIIFCELIFTCNIINIMFWCDWLTFNSNSEILSCIVFELYRAAWWVNFTIHDLVSLITVRPCEKLDFSAFLI